jgi:plasmid stability protein
MGQIIIRNLDDAVVARLQERAAAQGLSLEESLRRSLAALAQPSKDEVLEEMRRSLAALAQPSKDEILEEMRRIRAMSPARTEPPFAEDLVREGREER